MRISDVVTENFPLPEAVECDCGGHTFSAKIAEQDGVSEIASRLPHGSVAALVWGREDHAREYARRLRKAGIVSRPYPASDTVQRAQSVALTEDVRMLVAVGGSKEADFAKYAAKIHNLPVFVAVTHSDAVSVLGKSCVLYNGNELCLCEGKEPFGAAIVPELVPPEHLPAAFGNICACALSLFDREAYARATGTAICPQLHETVLALVYRALDTVAASNRRNPELPARLAQIALRLSYVSQHEDLAHGAADDCARTADMLFRRENRVAPSRGEFAFVFGAVLCAVYREFVRAPHAFTPPPDNNLRAELLCEYLGWDELTAARAAVSRVRNLGLAAYRINEYRDELISASDEAKKVFDEGKKYFRRLYEDDGYGMKNRIDPSDVKTVTALAPDTHPLRGNALLLMRDLGLLERYLV